MPQATARRMSSPPSGPDNRSRFSCCQGEEEICKNDDVEQCGEKPQRAMAYA
jgi:hypothetical protein